MSAEVTITWNVETDDANNTVWTAAGPYQDQGDVFNWRIRQRLTGDRVEFYAAHDAELGGETGDTWSDLAAAQAAVQAAHDGIVTMEVP